MVLGRTIEASRTAGEAVVQRLLAAVPARASVWTLLSADDQEIMTVWLGMPRWPAGRRRDRRRRAASALDIDADTVHEILHSHGDLGLVWSASDVPPPI
jgi:hypothetical protein